MPGEIVLGLLISPVQVFAPGFLLHKQNPFPQQINIAVLAVHLFDPLLEGGHPLPGDPENMEKRVPKRFRFRGFRGLRRPFLGKF